MRLTKLKLIDHILCGQSRLRANLKNSSSIFASSGAITVTENRNWFNRTGYLLEPFAARNNIVPLQRSLRANEKFPTRFLAPRYALKNGLINSPSMSSCLPTCIDMLSGFRAYSSLFGSKAGSFVANGLTVHNSDVIESGGADIAVEVSHSVVDATDFIVQKANDASDVLTLVQQLYDPLTLRSGVIAVCWTLTCTLFAWLVVPMVLRKLHNHFVQDPAALLFKNLPQKQIQQIPYEMSLWGSLEDPVKCLSTFMVFSQLGVMIAPTSLASQNFAQGWSGAVIVSAVWFIHRWKFNVFCRASLAPNLAYFETIRISLDNLLSAGLFVFGSVAMARTYGMPVQSTWVIIQGIAFALADDAFGRLSMQFLRPFLLKDAIKVGSVEGDVVRIGLLTTWLVNHDEISYVKIPNSILSMLDIVNKSRLQWSFMEIKIPIRIDDLSKLPQILDAVKSRKKVPKVFDGVMLEPYWKIMMGNELLPGVDGSYTVLTIQYNFKQIMNEKQFRTMETKTVRDVVLIISDHGGIVVRWSTPYKYKAFQ